MMDRRICGLSSLVAFGLSAVVLSTQTAMLSYRPVSAEFSDALDRIVMVSGSPNALHIYDPVSRTEKQLILFNPHYRFQLASMHCMRPSGMTR